MAKAKAKAKTTKAKTSSLTTYMNAAQLLTMASAILYGAMVAVTSLVDNNEPAWAANVGYYLLATTMVGGIAMGVLYAAQHLERK